MRFVDEVIAACDQAVPAILASQVIDRSDTRYGGFMSEQFHVDPRRCGFVLSELLSVYVTASSSHHKSEQVAQALRAAFAYLERHQRPDGCFDLTSCNYASAPDTAFMINAVLLGWWLLDKQQDEELAWLREPLLSLLNSTGTGIMNGGFHTPNHRWAIASCLLSLWRITGREELQLRAQRYLQEGLDINEDGEFAERSSGNYNQVNDDQMIRLYLASGDESYLEAARSNLKMMFAYIEPDGSIFTNNSTRQDLGLKLYTWSYFKLYLMVGHFLKDDALRGMADWIFKDCKRREGRLPADFETMAWLLLFPDMEIAASHQLPAPPIRQYSRMFRDSDIARVRRDSFSYTMLKGKPNCFYFQHGSFSLYMTIYANVCDKRHFVANNLEQTAQGYRMESISKSWYYLPFQEKPATSDWWAMDNEHSRERMQGLALNMLLEVTEQADGVDLKLSTSGLDQVPLRVEFSFLPGGRLRSPHFITAAHKGSYINVLDGMVEAVGPSGDVITIGPAFSAHNLTDRMGGAYPLSQEHATIYFTAYTPVDRLIRIRTKALDGLSSLQAQREEA